LFKSRRKKKKRRRQRQFGVLETAERNMGTLPSIPNLGIAGGKRIQAFPPLFSGLKRKEVAPPSSKGIRGQEGDHVFFGHTDNQHVLS